ncbi:MAG: hypothetical protein E6J77_07075 [Deltaproteobacteria bacterium]|nr:MAG: hypothetical protein E6J77_07075 [Deltaproteobacteria bacterium]
MLTPRRRGWARLNAGWMNFGREGLRAGLPRACSARRDRRFGDSCHLPPRGGSRVPVCRTRRAARTLAKNPELGHRFSRRLRRFLVRRFPYGLLYRVESDQIFIVAVAHLRRRPGYWRGRP